MKDVFISGTNIISSLGFTTGENFTQLKNEVSGIQLYENTALSPSPVYASLVDTLKLDNRFTQIKAGENYTRLEKMFILSIQDALEQTGTDIKSPKTLLIFSTTKGNIDLLDKKLQEKFGEKRLLLAEMVKQAGQHFKNPNVPVVVSNACVSGTLAIVIAHRLLQESQYENIVVSGGDITTEFVVSGFQSFKALSPEPCKPFDKSRSGLTLGEGCATMILTSNPQLSKGIEVLGGASSNDANHISGPSRTGEGLFLSIQKTLEKHDLEIDYVSAHGTATNYNDEMESLALHSAGLENSPVNSLKGYFAHTLGAAGVIESVAAVQSLQENTLIKSLGYSENGVSKPLNIIKKTEKKELKTCLKTSSGFGGCNATVLFAKK